MPPTPDLGRPVLVAGAGGFLGRRVITALGAQGREVVGILSPRATEPAPGVARFVRADVASPAAAAVVAEARPDVVLLLAVRRDDTSPAARLEAVRTNVLGTANLLEAAAQAGVSRVVWVGSALEYAPSNDPIGEDAPLAPTGYYAATKHAAAVLVAQFAERIPSAVILRPFGMYGPGQSPNRLVPTLLRAARDGREVPLTGPDAARDWVHVDDVAAAVIAAGFTPTTEETTTVNVGSGIQRTNVEVVETAREVTGRPIEVRVGALLPRPWDRACWRADTTRLRSLLGISPRDLRTGIAEMWEARAA